LLLGGHISVDLEKVLSIFAGRSSDHERLVDAILNERGLHDDKFFAIRHLAGILSLSQDKVRGLLNELRAHITIWEFRR
jgi:hypothetical protein